MTGHFFTSYDACNGNATGKRTSDVSSPMIGETAANEPSLLTELFSNGCE